MFKKSSLLYSFIIMAVVMFSILFLGACGNKTTPSDSPKSTQQSTGTGSDEQSVGGDSSMQEGYNISVDSQYVTSNFN